MSASFRFDEFYLMTLIFDCIFVRMKEAGELIVFYDGDCGFCNRTVQFVLKHEKDKVIRFSALQSDFAKSFFERNNFPPANLHTFYFFEEGRLLEKSSAAIRLVRYMRFPVNLLAFIWIVPKFLRDKGYDFIAKRRHHISKGYCYLPRATDKQRFLS